MIGYEIQCKYPYSYDGLGRRLDNAYKTIQLAEPHEAGEIIDDYWMICNENCGYKDENENNTGKFEVNYYVKVIDIRYFDVFATDINYDSRDDLKRLGTRMIANGIQYVGTVNLYRYIGTDYPEGF